MTFEDALLTKTDKPNHEDPTFDTCIVNAMSDFFFSQWLSFCFMEAKRQPNNRHFMTPQGKIQYVYWNGYFFELNLDKNEVYYRPDLDEFMMTL